MTWIVLGEEKGKVMLVSKGIAPGLLPKGTYLTIDEKGDAPEENNKIILRVDQSLQLQPYNPSPMIIDMDLSPLKPDQKCQNLIYAYRLKDLNNRADGFASFIRPQLIARRADQKEIELAMDSSAKGVRVFPATIYCNQNQLLRDEQGNYISVKLPDDMFYHQILICGSTGSGKTVATKYFAQYFVEELEGAVLAINVKDVDFLKMDRASKTSHKKILEEWKSLNQEQHPIENFIIYHPANTTIAPSKEVNSKLCEPITLDVQKIDPESLIGLLQNITEIGAQNFPNIFRFWQERQKKLLKEKGSNPSFKFSQFYQYFSEHNEDRTFQTMNPRQELSQIKLHPGTYDNVMRNLDIATDFFDNPQAKTINESDILLPGKMSVIDVAASKNGFQFGSILLRELLRQIVQAKSEQRYKVPVLIIIDEVHQFYNTNSSSEALSDLDLICRTGRSQKIGVIFSSQTPSDIPRGLSSVINTKIFFKSDRTQAKNFGMDISVEEIESLGKGFACCSFFEMSQLKFVKFPLSFAGVFEEEA